MQFSPDHLGPSEWAVVEDIREIGVRPNGDPWPADTPLIVQVVAWASSGFLRQLYDDEEAVG